MAEALIAGAAGIGVDAAPAAGVGLAAGPFAAGVITTGLGWRWMFVLSGLLSVAMVNGLALLLFDDSRFKSRVVKVAALALFVIACGGVHYFLEAILGAKYGFLTYVSF